VVLVFVGRPPAGPGWRCLGFRAARLLLTDEICVARLKRPRGRPHSAYVLRGVGAVVACALAVNGFLSCPAVRWVGWSDGWRAADSRVLINTRARATRLIGRLSCGCGTVSHPTS
jgi:hypothetical protein